MAVLLALIAVLFACMIRDQDIHIEISKYPDGKRFAFTITDDPDYGWLDQKYSVYDFLDEIGMKITIPVWVLDNVHGTGIDEENHKVGGITTNNEEYLSYTRDLQEKGHEIALHTVGPGNDLRDETILGYELFNERFGQYPKVNINHTTNLDNIYWGGDRFSNRVMSYIYAIWAPESLGHIEDGKYFWGDIAKAKTRYFRGWATNDINTLSANKSMPYHAKDKPYVNYWFGCSDGFEYDKFIKLISNENIEKLITERGTSIIYTHFAYGFVDRETNILNKNFIEQMTKISEKNGWFVPVSTMLDRFVLLRNIEVINAGSSVAVVNNNDELVNGLTIQTNQDRLYFFNTGEWISSNDDGEIVLGDMPPFSVFRLGVNSTDDTNQLPTLFERVVMVWSWMISR